MGWIQKILGFFSGGDGGWAGVANKVLSVIRDFMNPPKSGDIAKDQARVDAENERLKKEGRPTW